MATSFGLGIDQAGNGTTDEDLRRIIGAVYRVAGIISGCTVSTTSKMAYKVQSGAVILGWGADEKVATPVYSIEVPVEPNTGSSTRRDKIYVQQRTVSADGDNLAVVKVTNGAIPARSILLADYEVPAGATSTAGANDRSNRIYTRSVGSQYGQVAKYTDKDTTPHADGVLKRAEQQLFFGAQWRGVAPGDRDCTVYFNSSASTAADKTGIPVEGEGTVTYKFYLDGKLVHRFERQINQYRTLVSTQFPIVIQGGSTEQTYTHSMYYTVELQADKNIPGGKWQVNYGGPNAFPGDQFWVVDNGMANL